ncbi:alpha/beta hydrolase [Solimonas fluminis]|uniref:Alpha/beta hydrolase n=1 Tax=Solimonas fluminis TaxID=2086571 RepID=A0A2S5TGL1_9GAMM|nr:alpha/beta hydrolase [Solimonas fluminis]PPE74092.1 alpha/beta hydrolase [Solimonas fluminis]
MTNPAPPSRSEFIRARGLRFHIRRWGAPGLPLLFLGHGWLDVSATFDPVARILARRFQVLAPDWRGFGHSQWPQDGYWFPDYVADFEAIADHYSPDEPLTLVGHSMGAQILSLYAGLRPERVKQLVCLDGLFLPDMAADTAPRRLARWLGQVRGPGREKTYESFEFLASRVQAQHPQLSPERALFIARCWGQEDGRGRIRLLADPKHRLDSPQNYRAAESMAVWRQITAPTLFLDAGRSYFAKWIGTPERAERLACFRNRREEMLEEAGHMLHFDAPEETARRIGDFLT